MKKFKIASLLILLSTSTAIRAQVGINTTNPKSTLDITAKNTTGTTTNVDGMLIPRVDRQRAQNMTNIQTSTMIYVNDISTGTQTGTAVNINSVGFFYFDGKVWIKFSTTTGNTFVPSVVASGTSNTNITINDSSGFNKFTYTVSTNDGSWNVANNTYTVPKTGYYQVSSQANQKPSGDNNSFAWNLKYDNNIYQYTSMTNVQSAYTYNAGGVIVIYFTAGESIQIGAIPCKGCGNSYNVTTRSFTITYLGS